MPRRAAAWPPKLCVDSEALGLQGLGFQIRFRVLGLGFRVEGLGLGLEVKLFGGLSSFRVKSQGSKRLRFRA